MFHFSPSIEQRKFYNREANNLGVMMCSYVRIMNRQIVSVFTDRCLFTNCLHIMAKQLNYAWLTAKITV